MVPVTAAGGAALVSLDANKPKPAAIRPAKISMNHALRMIAPKRRPCRNHRVPFA